MSSDAMVSRLEDDETRRGRAAERVAYWTVTGYRDRLIASDCLLEIGVGRIVEAREATEEHWLLAAITDIDLPRPKHPTGP